MLTIEMLKQNTVLSGLTEDQLKAVAEMSKNDENTVIGTRIGELHGQYDNDILSISGIAKKDAEKSYDYLKRVLSDYKGKTETGKKAAEELKEAKTKIADLEAKIVAGANNEELTKQLNDAKSRAEQLTKQLATKEAAFTAEKQKLEGDIKNIHIDYAFDKAVEGIKFKAGIPESIHKQLLSVARAEVLSKGTPDFVDDGKGGKQLAIRDANGQLLTNPANNLNPYTIKELMLQTALKDVIDEGKPKAGGGTGPSGQQGINSSFIDLSGARTQLEADKIIEGHLLAQGLTRDSAEFAEQFLSIRNENNVGQLPIR